jgi:hypothetical protein
MKKLIYLFTLLFPALSFANIHIDSSTVYSIEHKKEETLNFKNADKDTVVIFLSKDCPCSKANIGHINDLAKSFPQFRFVGIHAKKGSKNEEIENYLSDKHLSIPVYNDADLKITAQFSALKTPHAFIVNKDGNVIYNGGIANTTNPDNAKELYLKDALLALNNHQLPPKAETRTLGCYIVR